MNVREATAVRAMHDKVARNGAASVIVARPAPAGRFAIALERREEEIARRVAGAARHAATAFQNEGWLRAWYATIGRTVGVPLLVTATDRGSGELAVMLPLVTRADGRLRIVEFADHGVSDSNAPILGTAAPSGATDAQALWEATRAALTDADLVRFTKMPGEVEDRVNPLALLGAAQRSPLSGNLVAIEGRFDDYLAGLKGMLRKQLRKSWRLFAQHDGAAFRRIDDPDEALAVLATLERQQGARLRAQGQPYRLDEPAFSAFYRAITAEGVADGSVILTTLMQRDEVVAALLGLARGDAYVMVRISTGAERWSHCSPGRLVIVKTMQSLHAEGYRVFDFSVGEYPYKRRLGARGEPLFELTAALTPRGLPLLAYDRAKQVARRYPAIRAFARRILQPKRPAAIAMGDDRD
jgi:CelD/BcsL family acetyltransferase involved in cellulose biosynthesis